MHSHTKKHTHKHTHTNTHTHTHTLKRTRAHSTSQRSAVQGGEDSKDTSICRSFSAKEPRFIELFCGKWPIKIRHPRSLRHPGNAGKITKSLALPSFLLNVYIYTFTLIYIYSLYVCIHVYNADQPKVTCHSLIYTCLICVYTYIYSLIYMFRLYVCIDVCNAEQPKVTCPTFIYKCFICIYIHIYFNLFT